MKYMNLIFDEKKLNGVRDGEIKKGKRTSSEFIEEIADKIIDFIKYGIAK